MSEGTSQGLDLAIVGGVLVDGSGGAPRRADVGVLGDLVVEVAGPGTLVAARTIDATGRNVAPGFIDIHTHSDISVNYHPEMESMLSQGVTTQVAGNCALSIGLATNEPVFDFENRWLGAHGARIRWDSMAGHLDFVAGEGVSTNYVMLAGQGTIRKRVMGMTDRAPDAGEMTAMERLMVQAMEQGAWGISTGLEYQPSSYAGIEELSALSRVSAAYGGFYATHLRNEGDLLVEAVREALEIGDRAGIAVQLSHHKAEGRGNWGKVAETLRLIEEARARGLDVQLDQYPYTAYMTSLAVQFLPGWAQAGTPEEMTTRLDDVDVRARITADVLADHPDWADDSDGGPWGSVVVGVSRRNRGLQGQTIAQVARTRGVAAFAAVMDLLREEKGFISAVNFAISDEDIASVLKHPLTMVGSDAVGTAPHGKLGEDRVHPRCYGTFTRVLGHYTRGQGVLTTAQAIRKMTDLPARRLGLDRRGQVRPGWFADLVVYDPAVVADRATYDEPHQHSAGIDATIVNGQVAWQSGAHTGVRAGRVLRKPR